MLRSRRVRRWLDQLLHTHDTPHRTAAAFAVGVFFGFSPFLGLHIVLGLVVAFAFRLNRVAVLLGRVREPPMDHARLLLGRHPRSARRSWASMSPPAC